MALGTSISAGILGGAFALVRGLAPGDEDDLRMLVGTARSETAWRATSGAGLVDMAAWIAMREGTSGDALHVGCTRDWVVPSASDVHIVARSNSHAAQDFSLFAMGPTQPRALGILRMREGFGHAQLDVPSWATEEVHIEARQGDSVRGRCVLYTTLDGSETPPQAFGGCTASRGRDAPWWVLIAFAACLRKGRDRRSA